MNKNKELQKFYRFSPEDLAKNKQGVITENQKKELSRRRLVVPRRNVIAISILVLVVTIAVLFNGGLIFLKHAPYYYMAGGAIAVVAAGSFIPLLFEKQDLKLKTAHGQAKIVDRIKEEMALSENGATFKYGEVYTRSSLVTEMFVEGVAFGVNGIVEHGDVCRIYYVGNGNVVSIEDMD